MTSARERRVSELRQLLAAAAEQLWSEYETPAEVSLDTKRSWIMGVDTGPTGKAMLLFDAGDEGDDDNGGEDEDLSHSEADAPEYLLVAGAAKLEELLDAVKAIATDTTDLDAAIQSARLFVGSDAAKVACDEVDDT